jgi:NAD(P)-dependent dehydrogenase (short-subunit alcohol dehydrogenase family)
MAENLKPFEGQIALVTGAGPNIGRQIALTLAEGGAIVYCNDIDEGRAKASADEITRQGYQAYPLAGNVADEATVGRMFDLVEQQSGAVNLLVNNAAITIPKGLFTITVDEWHLNTRLILDGVFFMCRRMAGKLVEFGQPGAIVNVASTSGHRGRKNAIAYTTAKAGVLNMTRSMAVELAEHCIRVNSVSPTKTGASVGAIESSAARSFDEIPLKRLGSPEDQANAVAFLLSAKAAFVTGEDIRVDGGSLATWGTRSHPNPVKNS